MIEEIQYKVCGRLNPGNLTYCSFCGEELPTSTYIPPIMQVTPDDLIKKSREKVMKEKQEKAPKVKGKETYVCPSCLEETLSYNSEERLFICSNDRCKKKFALAYIGY